MKIKTIFILAFLIYLFATPALAGKVIFINAPSTGGGGGGGDPCDGVTTFCVDPDAVGGGDGSSWADAYTTLDGALDTEAGDITGIAGGYIFYCRSSSGSDDTTVVSFAGYTTDGDSPITIIGSDFPSDGQYDDTKYVLAPNGTASYIQMFRINDDENITVRNLQISFTGTVNNEGYLAYDGRGSSNNTVQFDKCIFKGDEGSGTVHGFYISRNNWVVTNCLIIACSRGVNAQSTSTPTISQCTVTQCAYGLFEGASATVTATNNTLCNNTDDIYPAGGGSWTNCATDQGAGEGTNGINISGTWDSTCFTDSNGLGPDWSVQDTDSPLYHAGADLSLASDIIGTSWHASTPSVGCFEYQ